MKINFRNWLFILSLVVLVIISCTKENSPVAPSPGSQPGIPLPLGKEYILDSIQWQLYNSGYSGWDEVYLILPDRTDLFSNESWFLKNAVISVGLDTATNWTDVRPMESGTQLSGNSFYWSFSPYGRLVIYTIPLQRGLVGRKAIIRIKFL
jgi:hypothetical protein